MIRMRLLAVAAVLVLVGLIASHAVAGPKWELGEDSWMKLSFLGQVHYSHTDDAIDKDDIFLRRGRFILAGQVTDGILFFVETDNDNAGKRGADVSTDIQDAFADIRIWGDHWVEAGLVLLPFSFESKSSAASLLGIDYNAETVKFVNHFVWRDYGAELHGNFGKWVAYRVGVFDGYDPYGTATHESNPDADFRYTGHVALNLLGDVETGWFYSQSRLGSGNYVSVGAGYDRQAKATRTTVDDPADVKEQDSEAWVIDFQSGLLCGPVSLTVNGAYYDWDNSAFVGNTAFVEGGALAYDTMLTGKYSLQDADGADAVEDYTAGLHHFVKGHNARAGIEYRWGDSPDSILFGLQFLL